MRMAHTVGSLWLVLSLCFGCRPTWHPIKISVKSDALHAAPNSAPKLTRVHQASAWIYHLLSISFSLMALPKYPMRCVLNVREDGGGCLRPSSFVCGVGEGFLVVVTDAYHC